jgi:hypothetical protein
MGAVTHWQSTCSSDVHDDKLRIAAILTRSTRRIEVSAAAQPLVRKFLAGPN